MRNRLFIILAAVVCATLSGTVPALAQSGLGNPSVRNPVGPATVPQSSYRSGLFPSSNPIDTSGNDVITGNVGGGKHFRGVVPYNSTSNFAGTTGSTTLESFLRRSAGTGYTGNLPGGYSSYYSPTGTVTMMRPGLSSVIRPPTSQIWEGIAESTSGSAIHKGQTFAEPQISIPDVSYRPMRFSPQQLERLILDGVLTHAEARRLVDEQNLPQMERLEQDLEKLKYRAPQSRQSLLVRDDPLRPFSKFEPPEDTLKPFELPKLKEQTGKETQQSTAVDTEPSPEKDELINVRKQEQAEGILKSQEGVLDGDVYEQMKQQLEDVKKGVEAAAGRDKAKKIREDIKGKEQQEEEESLAKKLSQRETPLTDEEVEELEAEIIKQITKRRPQEKLSGVALSAKAKSIMGEHKTFASYTKDEFNQHMRAAEQYLKAGKYYRAADTYTLASIYKSDDPLAYAGKSHALFAAGEYMSSSLFLSRALEIFPEYARFKIDLAAMVGDRDKLESRIADIEQWLERSDPADLHFLLGYVFYQLGRTVEAKKEIDAAYEKLPESPAVNALKKAIDSAAAGNQTPD
jgi:tetratricopeptide (TPR) repeat protein